MSQGSYAEAVPFEQVPKWTLFWAEAGPAIMRRWMSNATIIDHWELWDGEIKYAVARAPDGTLWLYDSWAASPMATKVELL